MRVLASTFRAAMEASNSSEVPVLFVTITHPDMLIPIYLNSDIRDYVLNGNTFIGAAIDISILSDDSNPPQAKVTIPNVDRRIGDAVLGISTSPILQIELYAASDFTTDSPAQPIGTPTREYVAPYLQMSNVKCDALNYGADLKSFDLTPEPWPAIRTTRERLPGLYR